MSTLESVSENAKIMWDILRSTASQAHAARGVGWGQVPLEAVVTHLGSVENVLAAAEELTQAGHEVLVSDGERDRMVAARGMRIGA